MYKDMGNCVLTNPVLISIVIPVYKSETYLKDCVKSILAQTYPNFELILVDDGSPDKSGEMCEEMAFFDSRIRVFHKENGGAGSARNYALDRIKGEYVMFVDSDDYCMPNILQSLLTLCLKYDCDISSSEFLGKCQKKTLNKSIKIFTSNEILKALFARKYEAGPCCKLFHRRVIDRVRFPEGVVNEDVVFLFRAFQLIQRLVHIEEAYYYYLDDNNNSVTKSYKGIVDCVKNAYLMQDEMQGLNLHVEMEFVAYLHAVNINSFYSIVGHNLKNKYTDIYDETKMYCKRLFLKILFDKVLHYRFKVKCVLAFFKNVVLNFIIK